MVIVFLFHDVPHTLPRLHEQLSGADNLEMPKKGTQSIESQLTELKKVAKGKMCLIVLVRGFISIIRLGVFIDANSGRYLEC